MLAGTETALRQFISNFNRKFILGKVVHGSGTLRFFGINFIQHEDYTVSIHADDKLTSIKLYPTSHSRCRAVEEPINEIEGKAFMSINSSIWWLGITASPLCCFYSFYLQQKIYSCQVSTISSQLNALRILKKHGTLSKSIRLSSSEAAEYRLVAFADANHTQIQVSYAIWSEW